jgi:hypothetical protein
MRTRNLSGGKGRPARKVDNLTAISGGRFDVSQTYVPPKSVTFFSLSYSDPFSKSKAIPVTGRGGL